MDLSRLEAKLAHYEQSHLLQYWNKLTLDEQNQLYNELNEINIEEVCGAYRKIQNESFNSKERKMDDRMEPIPAEMHGAVTRTSPKDLMKYEKRGLAEIAGSHVAVLLLAGGQGTRLGVNYPKGMYSVGLPSLKTLYQIQAERLLRLQQLAEEEIGKKGTIPWYIMTSEHTKEPTIDFFASHNYFGLDKENLILFEQGMRPCFDFAGKIILQSQFSVAKAPDGNGGLYRALKEQKILEDMVQREVKYVHVYCVDNILVKMADPIFIGYCLGKNADCGAKVVEKAFPTEAVGVVCKVDGIHQVVEYSEIGPAAAQKRNHDGRLTFSAGNICNHFFTVNFLKTVCFGYGSSMKYHVAKKKIPFCSEDGKTSVPFKVNGIKMEKFVFDVFQFAENLAVWEVIREDEFAPLKNGEGAEKDTPTTCKYALYSLHHRYLINAGGSLVDSQGEVLPLIPSQKELRWDEGHVVVEISPLVSYAGEGLKEVVEGKKYHCPLLLNSRDCQKGC